MSICNIKLDCIISNIVFFTLMAYIHSVETAIPDNLIKQDTIQEFSKELFHGSSFNVERLTPVFQNAQIESRPVIEEINWYTRTRSFKEKNEYFLQNALKLSTDSAQKAIQNAHISPEDVDILVVVTSSGFATPTLDARLIDILGLSTDVIRIPLIGLGCAGGAYSLSRVMELSIVYPEKNILIIAVETCTLTFRPADKRKANFIALSLFSDGAAACVLSGKKSANSIKLLKSASRKWRNSLDVMGWDIEDDGLQVIFDRSIPSLVLEHFFEFYQKFLETYNIDKESIKHFLFHPGGMKVIDAFIKTLSLEKEKFIYSREVLRKFGNMSSPTILFVIKNFLENQKYGKSEKGIMSALGPGFTCELLLFETT